MYDMLGLVLIGVPTTGGGVVVEGVKGVNTPPCHPEGKNTAKKGAVSYTFRLINR